MNRFHTGDRTVFVWCSISVALLYGHNVVLYHYNEADTSFKRLIMNAIESKKSINGKFCLKLLRIKPLPCVNTNSSDINHILWIYGVNTYTLILIINSRTGWPLRNIHFSNSNVYFPCYVDILFSLLPTGFTGFYYDQHCVFFIPNSYPLSSRAHVNTHGFVFQEFV